MILDCRGQACPVPVIELAKALPTVDVGDVVEVLSDDPAARHDIPAWCRLRGQEFVSGEDTRFVVRRLS